MWLNDWAKRIKLTVSGTEITEDITDFPILITLSSGTGINNADATYVFDELSTVSGTKKIAVTTSNGVTQCYVEIECWDWNTEQAWLWAKIQTLASGVDTDLYFYYDSTKDDNTTYIGDTGDIPAQNVWDANFVGVWHMAQDPTGGSILDSTSDIHNGTPDSSMTSSDLVDGKIGNSLDFDGSNDYIGVVYDSSLAPTSEITCSVWAYNADWTSYTDDGRFISKTHSGGYQLSINEPGHLLGKVGGLIKRNDNYAVVGYARASISPGWHMFTFNYDGRYAKFYCDAILRDTNDAGGDYGIQYTYDNSLIIAGEAGQAELPDPGSYYNGLIDESRVSNIARSDAWVKASFYNEDNNLITFGTEENIPIYYFSGYVYEQGSPVSRKLYLHYRDDGSLIDTTTASGNGYYYLETTNSGSHYIVCLDDSAGEDYNDLIIGNEFPSVVT